MMNDNKLPKGIYVHGLGSGANTVIYARLSSLGDGQNTERQVMDLTRYATGNGYTILLERKAGHRLESRALKLIKKHVFNQIIDK